MESFETTASDGGETDAVQAEIVAVVEGWSVLLQEVPAGLADAAASAHGIEQALCESSAKAASL